MLLTDSQGRCFNEHALYAETHVASGAKIGHMGNVMEHTDMDQIENLVLNVGINNINAHPDTVYETWLKQVKCEVTHLSIQVKKSATIGRQIRIIEIPDCPITNMTQKSNKMRITVNKELSDMAERINKNLSTDCVKMIQCGEEELPQEEAYCDNKHFSPVRAAQLLEQIDESLKPSTTLIIRERPKSVPLTTPKIYSQVYSTYRFGCGECTRIGHSSDTCQASKNSPSPKGGTKRAASHGHSPEAKKSS